MKKIKLFLAATAAMVTMGVNAQTWTASEVGTGDFYLYNVGTGQYFTKGNGWGTQASITTDAVPTNGLKLTLEAVGTDYKIRTDVNGSGYGVEHLDGGTIYTDQSRGKSSAWTFTQVATNNGPVYTIVSAGNDHGGGAGVYMTAGVDGTIVTPGTDGTIAGAQWKLLDVAKASIVASLDRYATVKAAAVGIAANLDTTEPDAAVAAATTAEEVEAAIVTLRAAFLAELPNVQIPTDPGYLDVTAAMVDNAGVHSNTDFWTIANLTDPGWNSSAGVCNYGECEFYQRNFKFYQTLAMKTGTWEFGVTGFHRAGNHNTHFYAGEDKILIPGVESSVVNSMSQAKDYFDNGNGKVALKFIIESDQEVEIGIDNQDTETDKWTIFRDFTLKYYGPVDYSVYTERLAELAAEAEAIEGTVPAAVYSTLNDVVTENNKEQINKAAYLAAIEAIEDAITEAKTYQSAYAAYLVLKNNADALAAADNDNPSANAELVGAISEVAETVEAATTIDAINAVAEPLKSAMTTYVSSANPIGDAKFDCTFMLTNPDLTNLPSWQGAAGWYTDQYDENGQVSGNSQVMNNDDATSADGTKTKFYEYWSNPAKDNNEFTLYQKVTLPKGTYDISCYAFAIDQYAGQNSVGVYFYANDTQGSAVTTNRLAPASLSFVQSNDEATETKIGLKAITGNSYNWMGIGYVELYKVPAVTIAIAEDADYTPESVAGQVTLTRTFAENAWSTFVVPFQITNEELVAAFGEGVEVAQYSETVDENDANLSTINFNKMETPAISANHPVLIQGVTASANNDYVFENRTVATGDAVVAGINFNFVGTYAANTTIAAGDYFIGGNCLWKSTGATTIQGTRAYIQAKSAGVKAMMYIDGIATGIEAINGTAVENGTIFNLAGQQVSKAQKGIYVVNGKKVIVK